MTIKFVKHDQQSTIISIEEPTPYREPDIAYDVVIEHDLKKLQALPKITKEELNNLPNNRDIHQDYEIVKLPNSYQIVFINDYDTEYSSASYRQGAHDVIGPYLLVE